mgnify:CR=1 FL=1
MTVLYYDSYIHELSEMYDIAEKCWEALGEVILLPKDFEVFLDCSTSNLEKIKEEIERAIASKKIINEM